MFECPVDNCGKELSKLQYMHFIHKHNTEPLEWVNKYFGDEIEMLYNHGWGIYKIEEEYEFLSRKTVYNVVEERGITRTHEESVTEYNGMKRDSVSNQFKGKNNPSKRSDVKEKIRDALSGEGSPWFGSGEEHPLKNVTGKDHPAYGISPVNTGRDKVEETGHVVRSSWEEKIDLLLHDSGLEYEYESQRFDLDNQSMTYLPDFKVDDNIVEVKGWANEPSQKKAEMFVAEYPDYRYIVVGDKMECDVHIEWEDRDRLVGVLDE